MNFLLQYWHSNYLLIQLMVFLIALAIDLAFGDPPEGRMERLYPIVWISRLMFFFDRITMRGAAKLERVLGIGYAILIAAIFSIPCLMLSSLMMRYTLVYIIAAAPVFKMTFTVKGLERYGMAVIAAHEVDSKRDAVGKIVSRDVTNLDIEHLNSATVESVAENLTDSVIAPFFYFVLFGVAGAMLYRVINTLDAVVGYKTERYRHFGWFSARADDALNYIPERIAAGLILLVGAGSIRDTGDGETRVEARAREHVHRTIKAMSSVLRVKLEKLGHYSITGTGYEVPRSDHIVESIRIVRRSALLFSLCYAVMVISLSIAHALVTGCNLFVSCS